MHYVLKDRVLVPATLEEWSAMFQDGEGRRVALTQFHNGFRVSTVFLGMDHRFDGRGPPIVFESMVFPYLDSGHEIDMDRYCTWEEAEEGHERLVKKYRKFASAG